MAKVHGRIPDEYVFFVCERFLNGEGATRIAEWLANEGLTVSREQVYALVRRGIALGYVKLCPPQDMALTRQLSTVFPRVAADIQVLDVEKATALEHLTMAGADKALLLIKELGSSDRPVHIGLGAGRTSERFARNLALRLRSESEAELPKLVVHAMSSGFSPRDPTTAPVAFFSFFAGLRPKVEFLCMFSEPFVPWSQYEMVKDSHGVREAFEDAQEIDIVVSSLSSRQDEHGLFNEFLTVGSPQGVDAMDRAGWVGDVQFRPYSDGGPIMEDTEIRPVTLFELEDLVEMSMTPDKHVILIAAPCAACGRDKSDALRPLMRQPSLHVFNHLITDAATASALLLDDGDDD